jgi:hypothetical protein
MEQVIPRGSIWKGTVEHTDCYRIYSNPVGKQFREDRLQDYNNPGLPQNEPEQPRAMIMQKDVIRRLQSAIPRIRSWIDRHLEENEGNARELIKIGYDGLADSFPQELLARTRVVMVRRVPFPPLADFGVPELLSVQHIPYVAITFKDTFFVQKGELSESLCFHELVHVVQWNRLGVDNFLMAYVIGLLQFGYEQCPLEELAYSLERCFHKGTVPSNLVGVIEERSNEIWRQADLLAQSS